MVVAQGTEPRTCTVLQLATPFISMAVTGLAPLLGSNVKILGGASKLFLANSSWVLPLGTIQGTGTVKAKLDQEVFLNVRGNPQYASLFGGGNRAELWSIFLWTTALH